MDGEKCYSEYSLYGSLAIGLAAGVIAGMAIYASMYPIFQSKEWAAWVQAIGSVLAVVAAFMTVSAQSRRDRRNEAKSRKAQLDGAVSIAAVANGTVSKKLKIFKDRAGRIDRKTALANLRRPFNQLISALDKVPFHEVPYAYASTELMNIKLAIQGLITSLGEMSDSATSMCDEQFDGDLIKKMAGAHARISRLADTARAISKAYDGHSAPDIKGIRTKIKREHSDRKKKNTN